MSADDRDEGDVRDEVPGAPLGLSTAEAVQRLQHLGPNRLERGPRTSRLVLCTREFTHVFALVLWVAAGLAVAAHAIDPAQRMGELALAIVAVIVVNGLFAFWQVHRAEEAFAALQHLLPREVTAWRDGRPARVPAEALVPGDVIHLTAGDGIPADCRVLEARALRVDVSTLTGESRALSRDAAPAGGADVLGRRDMLLAGTSVVAGWGRAVVTATGMHTEFGRITKLARAVPAEPSPLQREIARLSHVITVLAVTAGVAVFLIGETLHLSRWTNLVFAVGLIVANVPEGLLPTLTLALSLAARRMARRHVLVRRLTAVETLGATTVICTDKTGTLTENRMAVRAVAVAGRVYEAEDWLGARHAGVPCLFESVRRCHGLVGGDGQPWRGDPMEIALVQAAEAAGASGAEKVDELPFDADRRRLVTMHRDRGGISVYVKGAPETVVPACRQVMGEQGPEPLDAVGVQAMAAVQARLAERGLRVLAVAHRWIATLPADAPPDDELTLDGLVALEDPARHDVPEAIARCRAAGIRVLMVTGDHPATALGLGRSVGLYGETSPMVLTGGDVERLSDAQLGAALGGDAVLLARMSPEDKMRVVRALRAGGAVVAVTGDGVNDAPALRAADIGIAMGRSGTDVARGAADLVLLDDNFAAIVAAVEEGRAVYDNIGKFLTYILTSNVPEVVPYLAFVLLGWPLALTVPQILAIDLGTDLVPALGLGAEPAEADVMARPPRARTARLLTPALLGRAYLWLGGIEAAAAMWTFVVVHERAGLAAGSTACLAAVVLMQVANVQVCRSRTVPGLTRIGRGNPLIVAGVILELLLMAAIAYTAPGQALFGTVPIDPSAWLVPVPFAVALLLADLALKRLPLTRRSRAADASAEVPKARWAR